MPEASEKLIGLLLLYVYGLSCCGSPGSVTGSTEMNRPSVGSYSRAPRCTSPVESLVPPTKPRLFGHAADAPRCPPYGVCRRIVDAWVTASIDTRWVPWWSALSQLTPAAVRWATTPPPKP